jgi:TolA-binding protein
MTKPNLAPDEVVRQWRDAALPEDDTEGAAQRQAIVDLMQRRLESTVAEVSTTRQRSKRWLVVGGAVLASAAALALWQLRAAPAPTGVATMRSVEGSVSVQHAGAEPGTVTHDTTLAAGDQLVTAPDGRTSLQLGSGVSLTLGAASRLRLPDAQAAAGSEQVRLEQGIVEVRVPHLVAGHSFHVRTPDAEVTVHGTAFTVEVGQFVASDLPLRSAPDDANLTTRVRVSEGVVAVASAGREVMVSRGMQWMSPRAEPSAPAASSSTPSALAPSPLPSSAAPPAVAPAITPSGTAAKPPTSKLAEQTALLQSASEAARHGNQRGAISSLSELLHRYPDSSLAHEARLQLFRALAASGDTAGAAREARRYLAAYPNGPARDEAQKIALPH